MGKLGSAEVALESWSAGAKKIFKACPRGGCQARAKRVSPGISGILSKTKT